MGSSPVEEDEKMTIAPRLLQVTLDAARDISADSVVVYGLLISNATAAAVTVTIEDNDNTDLFQVQVAANSTFLLDVPFRAENGIGCATAGDADVTVTAFYSQVG